ncbi:hypothetical protein EUAN_06740 [Andreesenia angusta]|uniref:Cache domain-containing protein n=1 Tax=Andreesenia angusta TaxID=39480 RepID=A0A1S1V915_9FIRM|nr:hypothetical protein [Andreesenia angusta]OHW62890.1 hypothetical protein EUAN_06740 [Andreesenia angusta]
MNKPKQFATIVIVVISLLTAISYLSYKNRQHTFEQENNIERAAETARVEMNKAIYESLLREATTKTDRVSKEIRSGLLSGYGDNLSEFSKDYSYPTEDSILVTTIDDIIHNEDNRFFYIENDANDMFVSSTNGIVSDKSQDCAVYGITRTYDEEISMHFNKALAKEAIEALQVGEENIFWRFKGPAGSKDVGLKKMDIDKVLELPLEEIKDYEFLAVSYIDRYGDIMGTEDVTAIGQKQDSKKLMVVQGFNLYDHIQESHKSKYIRLDKEMAVQLAIVKENRKKIEIEGVLLFVVTLVSMLAVYVIQEKSPNSKK